MSLQYAAQVTSGIIPALSMAVLAVAIPIQVNPPKIVTISDDEFTIDMHAMEQWVPYGVTFGGSRYLIWKNGSDELVMIDAEMFGSKPDDG